jgi:hypothetical protein
VFEAAGRDVRVQAVLAGDRDVVLGEVAGVAEQHGVGWQLRVDRAQVAIELPERRFQQPRVRCLIGQLAGDDHLGGRVDDRLAVVALVKRAIRGLHDLALRVCEVALHGRLGLERVTATGRVARRLALLLQLGAPRGLGRGCLSFQRLLRLPDRRQARLATLKLIRQLVSSCVSFLTIRS